MTNASQAITADLSWTEQLPTVSGHYFVARGDGLFGSGYEWIDVTGSVVSSLDRDYDKFVYELNDGYLFFGPILIPEPPVSPQPEVILAANQIDGDVSNV